MLRTDFLKHIGTKLDLLAGKLFIDNSVFHIENGNTDYRNRIGKSTEQSGLQLHATENIASSLSLLVMMLL